ncbi:methyltransferase domain protein [Gleimia coleocanis DSM 15436]|uniref:Methyltransferase domain protein n=1 Tax=Gleimia coleocanis DSM 15436 TaxID=525245 RepID=C0W212_9ACTO|nr:class I SAM-dependent methyltransferase [Gleimia coleocanis]EEH63226.1 methyltransferase domain protein [Gleimia coleocanis DSM 15436]
MNETVWDENAPENAFEKATAEYSALRPDYPYESVLAALQGPNQNLLTTQTLTVADIGAGTGKLSAQLTALVKNLTAVEPAHAMRTQCDTYLRAQTHPNNPKNWEILDGTAEKTGLPNQSQDVITYAQCWHWVEPEAAAKEAKRILKPGGHIAILYNQMDVTIPWVQRLSRIMRSGDIHSHDKPPRMTTTYHDPKTGYPTGESVNLFTEFSLHQARFSVEMAPQQVLGLGRTRSSYLKSTAKNREKMQENLRWYLYEHLGYQPGETISIPYYTLTWMANVR